MTNFENEIVRALWMNNPFAHLMLHGKIETRKRPTNVRGLVLLCSCQKEYTQQQVWDISGYQQGERIKEALWDLGQPWNGYAICIGNLVDCRPMTPADQDACFVRYRHGLWCWEFQDVQPVKYFQIKGKQGWKILTSEEKQKIELL